MKKGILVVSFGTSYSDTRAVTIDAIEKEIKGLFADVPFYRAWTSRMILSKLQETTGEKIFTVSEALLQMKKDGVTDVYIQPTHVINGIENDRMKEDALALQEFFSLYILRCASPFLNRRHEGSCTDYRQLLFQS